MARALSAFATIALGLASGGCSFLFVDGPPPEHEKKLYFDCTSTAGLEVADGVFALSTTLAGVGTLGMTDKEYEDQNGGGNRKTAATVDFILAGVFAGSALYGFIVTEKCSDAKEALRQRIIERERKRSAAPPLVVPAPAAPPAAVPPPASAQPPASAPPPATPPPPAALPPPPPPAATTPAPSPTPAPPPKPGSASF